MTKPSSKYGSFSIIRHYNSPNIAEYRGLTVRRREKIYVDEVVGDCVCAPYDDHFIFEVPEHIIDSRFRCTCGSPAIVPGSNPYKHLASPTDSGYLLVCMVHLDFGQHSTG